MAATVVASYSLDHFQRLSSRELARKNFLDVDGDAVLDHMKDFFRAEGMDRKFGLVMSRRHFNLASDEVLVDYYGTSTPWNDESSGMRAPQPSSWAFDDGSLKPIEFHHSESQDEPWTEEMLSFITKLKTFLYGRNLQTTFGLVLYPGDDFRGSCEVVQGRANINLKPEDYPHNLTYIDTTWFFSPTLWDRGCRCTCASANGSHGGHGQHVYTT